jgi:alpha-tubulin suppressor-like RCC1 family protein
MPVFRRASRSLLLMICLGLLLLATSAGTAAAFDGRTISAAAEHSCGIDSAGAAKCWGDGYAGRLGDGTQASSFVPVQVDGLTSGVTVISAGDTHSCAIVGGAAKCWGDDYDGQLGNGADGGSNTPVDVDGLGSGVTAISAGNNFTCAVVDGAAMCWGSDVNGNLGNGTDGESDKPVAVVGLETGVTAISTGNNYACAIVSGAAKCWGSGWNGQLGNGDWEASDAPVDVFGLNAGVTSISAGFKHTCAVVSGAAKCWGGDLRGQLGNGPDLSGSNQPGDVVGLSSGVSAISAGNAHSCAIVSGVAKCWGEGEYDQLGQAASEDAQTPVDVVGVGSGVTAISAGYRHTCVIAGNRSKCWGENSWGQLGNGSNGTADVPVGVSGLTSAVTLISAGARHSCAIASGVAKCWGDGTSGQLGDGTSTSSNVPVDVTDLGAGSGVTAVSAGDSHSCAVVGGTAKCWGSGSDGQLGEAGSPDSPTPVDVEGLSSGVTAISAGRNHTCAVVSGAAMCWGSDTNGKLGNGPDADHSDVPIEVEGLDSGVTAISAGDDYTCAIVNDAAKCWGYGWDGQLGDGTATSSEVPLDVADIPVNVGDVVSNISTGGVHTCAVSAGAATCWGYDEEGQLGNGPDDYDSYTPFPVVGLTAGVTAISVGLLHSCAIVSGSAKCWGNGQYGRLGNGDDLNSQSPVDVTTGPGETVEAIDAGAYHTCAIISGAAKCWGDGYWGGLGDGSSGTSPTPVGVSGFTPLDVVAPTISNVVPLEGFSTTDPSISLTYTVTDDVDPSPVCTPASGSVIALSVGANAITIDCADATGNHAAPVVVNVTRVTPPAPPAQPASPAAAKVKPRLRRSGKAKIKGKRVAFKAITSFKIPTGASKTTACRGKIKATIKPKGTRRAAKASGKLKAKGSSCQARLSFKLPKQFKGKKVKITLSFAGNSAVAKFKQRINHSVR